MQTGTAARASDASSDSLAANRPKSNSAKSQMDSPKPSVSGPAEDDGVKAEPTLTLIDYLLTLLQSDLSELKQEGLEMKFYQAGEVLQIALTNVFVCPTHQILHSGRKCHQCK